MNEPYLGMAPPEIMRSEGLRLWDAKQLEEAAEPLSGVARRHVRPRLCALRQVGEELLPEHVDCTSVARPCARANAHQSPAATLAVPAPSDPQAYGVIVVPYQCLLALESRLPRSGAFVLQRIGRGLHPLGGRVW